MATLPIEHAIRYLLINDASVSGVVVARVFPGYIPQGSAFPAIVYERGSSDDVHFMGGQSGLNIDEEDLTLYGESYDALKVLAKYVKAVLDGTNNGTTVTIGSDSVRIDQCHLSSETETVLSIDDGSGRYLHSIEQTYSVAHKD